MSISSKSSGIDELEQLESEENHLVEERIHEMSSELGPEKTSQLLDAYRTLAALNNELVELFERIDQGEFLAASRKLQELERKRENVAQEMFEMLREVDIDHGMDIESIEQRIERLEQGLENEIRQKATEEAAKVIEKRETMVVEERPLERFLKQVKEVQLGRGEETAGLFQFQERSNAIVLEKYVPLENRIPDDAIMDRSEAFNPGEDEERLLEQSDGDIVFAHSHPPEDDWLTQEEIKSHSDMDESYQSGKLDIRLGLLAAPDPEEDWIWLVPQYLEGGEWKNMELQISRGGKPLGEKELKSEYPQVASYNQAIVKTLAYQELFDDETSWLHYYRQHVKRG